MNKKKLTYALSSIALLLIVYLVFIRKSKCGNPKNWGPKMWFILHTVSLQYSNEPTSEEKKAAFNFINSLPLLLPCVVCKDHLREHFKHMPLTFDHLRNRETFSKYVYDLHEMVNKQLGKKSGIKFKNIKSLYNCA